ncbi:DUF4293 domain-containing protein [Chitinophaga horti]|uniref:DUF4293 domain-containing protein n=1 Tax=Chitinophaga horti TaxID=2920382 RepID=A0ABY6J1U9_9BACT|nr:DUF4293 domain-containing protein [Chitinophaga horti]UYQ92264.1 DUF4293 domain-containing protein [Chitinophaga horti]
MIQRIQSLYLLLAAGAGAATWFYNLWKANVNAGTSTYVKYFNAQESYLVFIVYMVIVALALLCIFLYKNRKLQFRLTVLNVFLTAAAIILQYFKVQATANALEQKGQQIISSSYLPAAFLPVLMLILLILAARGIYKDEKLIKSLDRLR